MDSLSPGATSSRPGAEGRVPDSGAHEPSRRPLSSSGIESTGGQQVPPGILKAQSYENGNVLIKL